MIRNAPQHEPVAVIVTKLTEDVVDTYKGEPVRIPKGFMVKVIDQLSDDLYKISAINERGSKCKVTANSKQLGIEAESSRSEPPVESLPLIPRIYQEYGCTFLLYKQRAELADAPGVGKTLQAGEAAFRVTKALEQNVDPLTFCYQQHFEPDEKNTHPDSRPEWAEPNPTFWWGKHNPVVVIVAPSHLCNMWFKHVRRQYPNEHVAVGTNDTYKNRMSVLEPGCRFYIVNYEMMRPPKDPPESAYEEIEETIYQGGIGYRVKSKKLRANYVPPRTYAQAILDLEPCCVIFDEAHKLKAGKRSTQAVTCEQLALKVPYVFLLTATPIKREADDLHWQLHIIDPDRFKEDERTFFIDEYCFYNRTSYGKTNIQLHDMYKRRFWWNKIGAKDSADYDSGSFLTTHENKKNTVSFERPNLLGYVLGRSYHDVGLYLPKIIPATIPVNMDTSVRKIYEKTKTDFRVTLDLIGESLSITSLIGMLHSLRILTACDNKYEAVKELVEDNEGPWVIFTEYKPSGKHLAELFDTPFITGEIPDAEREEIIAKTIAEGKPVVGMGRVIGTGINALADCNVLINFESDYTPGERTQRIGRVQRYSPNRKVDQPILLFDVMVTDSIDEHVYEVAKSRGKSIKDIISVELGLTK